MKSELELIATLAHDIGERVKTITSFFSKEQEPLLRHLSASAIHMSFFMKDIHDAFTKTKTVGLEETEQKFLANCGCEDKNELPA